MDASRLAALLDLFHGKTILVVGDVMLDRFIWGSVSRISPEAPVPVVHVEKESAYPGGAANVARNLSQFAKAVHIMGVIGPGVRGEMLAQNFEDEGLDVAQLVTDPDYETIVKTRVVARGQQVVRIDRETPRMISEASRTQMVARIRELLPTLDGIILEDYGKGLLSQDFVDDIISEARKHEVCITVDPNPNNPIQWRGVTAIKPNRVEAFQVAGMPGQTLGDDLINDPALLQLRERLRQHWKSDLLVVTLGDRGMVLMEGNEPLYHVPPKAREVYDVSGAGDTAIAIFTLALSAGASPQEATELSNHASSLVVGKVGTATILPDELAKAVTADTASAAAS